MDGVFCVVPPFVVGDGSVLAGLEFYRLVFAFEWFLPRDILLGAEGRGAGVRPAAGPCELGATIDAEDVDLVGFGTCPDSGFNYMWFTATAGTVCDVASRLGRPSSARGSPVAVPTVALDKMLDVINMFVTTDHGPSVSDSDEEGYRVGKELV